MSDEMTIEREDKTTHGTYRIAVEGAKRPAELTWKARGDVRIADSTFVPPEARGKGVAGKLVKALIADAREQGFKIQPSCSYVVAAFERHPEWADLRA